MAVMLCMSKMSKIDQIHLRAVMLCMSQMLKIDQIHLRAVMLCMSKMSKMGKEHTHTFWLITSLILNGFSIRKKFWNAETWGFPTIPSLSSTSSTCFNIHKIFFRIENPLSIKEVMRQNVCVCSFPIFDIFDIHSITDLRCI